MLAITFALLALILFDALASIERPVRDYPVAFRTDARGRVIEVA